MHTIGKFLKTDDGNIGLKIVNYEDNGWHQEYEPAFDRIKHTHEINELRKIGGIEKESIIMRNRVKFYFKDREIAQEALDNIVLPCLMIYRMASKKN